MQRAALARYSELQAKVPDVAAGSLGQARHRGLQVPRHQPDETFTHFEDKPSFDEVDVLAKRYLVITPPAGSIGWTWPTCGSRA